MKTFQQLYDSNSWGNNCRDVIKTVKMSSDTKFYITKIREIIKKYNIKNALEVGCGNFECMKYNKDYFEENQINYTGTDIVEDNIIKNTAEYQSEYIKFKKLGVLQEDYDLVIIKDVIQHYDTDEAINMIDKLCSNNKYVFCINGYKFSRKPEKNNWTERVLDKKYRYHPISSKKELVIFNDLVKEISYFRNKEYILYN